MAKLPFFYKHILKLSHRSQDYRQEYTRTKANLTSTLERRDLLDSVHRDISDFRDAGSRSRKQFDETPVWPKKIWTILNP
jgi:hypothetical protein